MLALDKLPQYLHERVRGELDNLENILWIGQPIPLSLFFPRSVNMKICLGVFVLIVGILVVSLITTTPSRIDSEFMLTNLAPLLVFLILLVFLYAKEEKNTVYIVTNKRAIILKQAYKTSVNKSYSIERLQSFESRVNADGSGDLIFISGVYFGLRLEGFFKIPNVREVENIIRGNFNK